MNKVISDPASIRNFQRQLRIFNGDLESIIKKLKSQLNILGEDWRDSEFHKFEQQMDDVVKAFNRYLQESDEYVRYLNKKAEPLEDYLR